MTRRSAPNAKPDTVRGADVGFYSHARFPSSADGTRACPTSPPDLVVEVYSPSNRRGGDARQGPRVPRCGRPDGLGRPPGAADRGRSIGRTIRSPSVLLRAGRPRESARACPASAARWPSSSSETDRAARRRPMTPTDHRLRTPNPTAMALGGARAGARLGGRWSASRWSSTPTIHLDSDLAVDGLTLLEATRGHWRWHYPGTPYMGIAPRAALAAAGAGLGGEPDHARQRRDGGVPRAARGRRSCWRGGRSGRRSPAGASSRWPSRRPGRSGSRAGSRAATC